MPFNDLYSGALGGFMACVTLQPLDLIKTRLQQTPHATSIAILTRNIIQATGISSLWKGTFATLLRNVPGGALYFYTLSHTRTLLLPICNPAQLDLLSGSLSRSFIGLLLMPMTVLKTRFESNKFVYNGIGNGLSTIWRTEGLKGLLSGWGVTILRDAPYAGLYIFFYNRFKPFVSTAIHDKNYCNFISGIGAGIVSTTICHPFDVVKTRVQLNNKMGNMWGAIKFIIKNEPPSSFFSGYVVRGMRKVLGGAITWTVYEYCVNRSN